MPPRRRTSRHTHPGEATPGRRRIGAPFTGVGQHLTRRTERQSVARTRSSTREKNLMAIQRQQLSLNLDATPALR